MTAILGISAFYHDSAAALVVDGRIVAAAQEERFTREKYDASFPQQAIKYCLEEARIRSPISTTSRSMTSRSPSSTASGDVPGLRAGRTRQFQSRPASLAEEEAVHCARPFAPAARGPRARKLLFLEHHESHAASAFFPSPFKDAAILTLDGVGEWSTAALGTGTGNRLTLTRELRFPHSLGLLYSAFTYYCGFKVNCGEYKLMGLAPYGRPIYRDLIYKHLIDLKPDGSLWLDMTTSTTARA